MWRPLFLLLCCLCFCWTAKARDCKQKMTNATSNYTKADPTADNSSSWQGFVAAVIAVIGFGSNFVPVKKFETGDGLFFQWILCVAIWVSGLVTNCIQNFPPFYPLAMFGGFLWATGNICVVPIIKTIGLGLGLLIWGSFNLLSGWASGSAGFWLFVKSDVSSSQPSPNQPGFNEETSPILQNNDQPNNEDAIYELSWEDKLSTTTRRIIGCGLAIFSGILYGLNFAPVIYIQDNYPNAPKSDIDYVFAHFCGIFTTSTLYFVIYCAVKKNKPTLYPSIILPALASGCVWAIADVGWFVANQYLSEAVSFPIITTGPGIIASLWGVLVFREVKGLRNFIIMGFAYAFTITGAVLAGLSKV